MTETQDNPAEIEAEKQFEEALIGDAVVVSKEDADKKADEEKKDEETTKEAVVGEKPKTGEVVETPEIKEEVVVKASAEELEAAVKLPARPSKHPELEEGDFIKDANGVYEVKAEHLAQDIDSILTKDANIFTKIAKAKPEKAAAIAEILGVKGDDTRSASAVLLDVVKYIKTEKDPAKQAEILGKHLPFLYDRNADVPFVMSKELRGLSEDEKPGKVAVTAPVIEQLDIDNAVNRIVAESDGKLTVDQIVKSDELASVVEDFGFDPKTGQPRSLYDQLSLAVKAVFKGEKSKEEVIAPDLIGGVSQKTDRTGDIVDPKEKALEEALMGGY